jgi:hypothetical protein
MVGFIKMGNPPGRVLTVFRRSHLRGNTPNVHQTIRHNYSVTRRKLICVSSSVYSHGTLNYPSRRSNKTLYYDLINLEDWRKLHNQELHNLYSSPNIIRMIKSRRMRWSGHVAQMGRRGMHTGYWWESQKERDHWEDQDVCGWTILKWILER